MNIRAHSVMALSPSWVFFKGDSINSILGAADWSSDATSKQFCYRELGFQGWESYKSKVLSPAGSQGMIF